MDISSSSDRIRSYDFGHEPQYIDKLLEKWKTECEENVERLGKGEFDILKSERCMSKSLSNTKLFIRSNICTGCDTLNRLNYDFFITPNGEIKIHCGTYKGDTLRLYTHKNKNTDIVRTQNKVSSRNPFVNYVLISSILNTITKERKFPYNSPYLWSYICNDDFNIVLNMKYMKTLREISLSPTLSNNSPLAKKSVINRLNDKIVKDIFIQLTLFLFFLSKFEFSHGEPSTNYITFCPHSCNYIFQNINVKSKIGLSICPSTKSSITYKKSRVFYSKNGQLNSNDVYENRDVGLDNNNYTGKYEDHRIIYNKIGNKYKNLLNLYCDEGKYIKSFDFIMFFTSLIADKSYFDSFREDKKMMYIWNNMWYKDQEKLMKELKRLEKNNFINVFDIVKKYYFRDDALDFAMKSLYEL